MYRQVNLQNCLDACWKLGLNKNVEEDNRSYYRLENHNFYVASSNEDLAFALFSKAIGKPRFMPTKLYTLDAGTNTYVLRGIIRSGDDADNVTFQSAKAA
ncbi:MAG: hypothetical protein PHF24_09380 [Syntrophomonas sp.]|nr:hypothetical protein [Syntrophomonas sp.]